MCIYARAKPVTCVLVYYKTAKCRQSILAPFPLAGYNIVRHFNYAKIPFVVRCYHLLRVQLGGSIYIHERRHRTASQEDMFNSAVRYAYDNACIEFDSSGLTRYWSSNTDSPPTVRHCNAVVKMYSQRFISEIALSVYWCMLNLACENLSPTGRDFLSLK